MEFGSHDSRCLGHFARGSAAENKRREEPKNQGSVGAEDKIKDNQRDHQEKTKVQPASAFLCYILEETVHPDPCQEGHRKYPEYHNLGGSPESVKSGKEVYDFVDRGVMAESQDEG
jgi:hypothetical protein